MTIVTKKSLSRRTVLRGLGRCGWSAVHGRDGSGDGRAVGPRRETGGAHGVRLRPQRHHGLEGRMDPQGRGQGLRIQRDYPGSGAVPRAPDDTQRAGAGQRPSRRRRARRPRPRGRHLSHRRAGGQDGRRGDSGRRFGRSDCRARVGQAHATGVARSGHRGSQHRRRLRFGLQLRLYQYDLLADADGAQPGGG